MSGKRKHRKTKATIYEWRLRVRTDYTPYTSTLIGKIEDAFKSEGAMITVTEDFREVAAAPKGREAT